MAWILVSLMPMGRHPPLRKYIVVYCESSIGVNVQNSGQKNRPLFLISKDSSYTAAAWPRNWLM
jgi:hypothetical protein